MSEFRTMEIKRSIFEDNDKDAECLRQELRDKKTFLLNLMSSPGAGKTTTLAGTIEALKDEMRIGVMEADIDSDVDAQAILRAVEKFRCLAYRDKPVGHSHVLVYYVRDAVELAVESGQLPAYGLGFVVIHIEVNLIIQKFVVILVASKILIIFAYAY